jgi:hypothetical protein
MLWCLLYILKFLFLDNVKISIFGGILKFFNFGQILAMATMTMAESMPSFERK